MPGLPDLYQEAILDHYRKPRNLRRIEHADRRSDGSNSFCGDKLTIFLKIDNDVVRDVSFTGSGCAISLASASMMTECLKGKTVSEAKAIFFQFHQMLTGHTDPPPDPASMGSLAIFAGVRGYPVRVQCALLAWNTMHEALVGTPFNE